MLKGGASSRLGRFHTALCGPQTLAENTQVIHSRLVADRVYSTKCSPLERNGFELPVRGRGQPGCRPFLSRRMLGTGRCAFSVFGQHDALHQSGVDPTAEAAIRAGDAQRRILLGSGRKRQRSTG